MLNDVQKIGRRKILDCVSFQQKLGKRSGQGATLTGQGQHGCGKRECFAGLCAMRDIAYITGLEAQRDMAFESHRFGTTAGTDFHSTLGDTFALEQTDGLKQVKALRRIEQALVKR